MEHGFLFNSYEVTTEDGYLLTLFRVRSSEIDSPVVMLQHGICSSAYTWINHQHDRAPAFFFAKNGFDVWLGNNRGNLESRRHQSLNPDTDPLFWDFSFSELGRYDIPAMIQKIKDETHKPSLSYIGHSQGTTQMFQALSENREVADSIDHFIALAPVARMRFTHDSWLRMVSEHEQTLQKTFRFLGIHELFQHKHW